MPEKPNNMNDEQIEIGEDFDGVFRFSNNSDEEFKALWNNKEYVFAPHSRSPMIIPHESLENIQEIRKRWAFKWAEEQWYKGEQYKKMSKMGGGLPPTRDDKVLEPLIQMCLDPLPIAKADVKDVKRVEPKFKGSRAVKGNTDLSLEFKDDNIVELGVQSNTFTQ